MKRLPVVVVAVLGLWGCAKGAGDGDENAVVVTADTLTRAQKDSVLATLPIPGAGAVGAARRAVELANQKTEAHDTIR